MSAPPPLRILMLAPEPFFEPRGTPFSELHRLKALSEDGHHVDLVTYPIGADVTVPNLRIIRSVRLPGVRRVPIGPSVRKLLLDLGLAWTAWRQARRGRYDAIHSHEEAGLLGVWLARRLRIPHLYDMHSSLPQQFGNFGYSQAAWLRRLFERIEQRMIGGSRVVITICQELQDTVTRMGYGERSILIENVMGGEVDERPGPGRAALRASLGLAESQPVVLYTGTFEPYQGLDMLLSAAAIVARRRPDVTFLIVGGSPDQVEAERRAAEALGAQAVFTGQRPPFEIPHFVEACDVLVSPRIAGTNTPLKIYSYLRSGKPIVASRLLTHTQVLDERSALLVEPTAEVFARAILRVVDHPEEGARLVAGAQQLAREKYSRELYLMRTRQAYARLMHGEPVSGMDLDSALQPGGSKLT